MGRQRHIRRLRREINQAVREQTVTPLGARSAARVIKGRARLPAPGETVYGSALIDAESMEAARSRPGDFCSLVDEPPLYEMPY